MSRDLYYALRRLRKTPAFTAAAGLTLALGVAIYVVSLAIVDAFAFGPEERAGIRDVYELRLVRHGRQTDFSLNAFADFEADRPECVLAAYGHTDQSAAIQTQNNVGTLTVEGASSGYSNSLRLAPEAGRWTQSDDERPTAEPVAVISDRLWRAWFSGDRSAVGRASVKIGRRSFLIVGVAPPAFRGPQGYVDVWLPLSKVTAAPGHPDTTDLGTVSLVVRIRPGITKEAATIALQAAIRRLPHLGSRDEANVILLPLSDTLVIGSAIRVASAVLALATLVLLAACSNFANMFSARDLGRMDEIALRVSLGATRYALTRLIVVEVIVVGVVGGAFAATISTVGLQVFNRSFPELPLGRYVQGAGILGPRASTIASAIGLALLVALLVGLTNAWRLTSATLSRRSFVSDGGKTLRSAKQPHRVQTVFVAFQAAAAVTMLLCVHVFIGNLPPPFAKRLYFNTHDVVAGTLDLGPYGYNLDRSRAFFTKLLPTVKSLPGVDATAISDSLPSGVGPAAPHPVTLAPEGPLTGQPTRSLSVTATYVSVSPGFLKSINLKLIRGRDFGPNDVSGATGVAILSQSAALALWPHQEPLNRQVLFGARAWLRVIGICADPAFGPSELRQDRDVPSYSSHTQPSNVIFVPFDQWGEYTKAMIVVRSDRPGVAPQMIRASVRALDADVPVLDVSTIEDSMFAWYGPRAAARVLCEAAGLATLSIEVAGMYGLISFFVGLRVRDFGVRLSLGAAPSDVFRHVVGHGVHVALVGLLPGVLFISLVSRVAENLIPLLWPGDILAWVLAPAIVFMCSVTAAAIPGWRASRLEPHVALRHV